MDLELYRPLTAKEETCLSCPLDECDETDERCPWRSAPTVQRTPAAVQAKKRTRADLARWEWLHKRISKMCPGESAVIGFGTRDEARLAGEAARYRAKTMGWPISTRRGSVDGRYILTVRRTDG